MVRSAFILLSLGCLTIDGVAHAQSTAVYAGDESVRADYAVGPRDVLEVAVVGEPELSGQVVVAEDGVARLPYVGGIQVTGRTVDEVAALISDAYRGDYLVNPQVTVTVKDHRSQQVEVYGAVKRQGAYYLSKPTTVLELLGLAGGVEANKSSNQVVLRHADGSTQTVNYDQMRATGEGNLVLEPGDTVTVQDSQFVYVAGHVEKPGTVAYFDGITVLNALIQAGGPAETARLKGAYILRDGEQIPVNIKRIQDGKDPDEALRPGDKLYLRESPI